MFSDSFHLICRESSAVDYLSVNPFRGVVRTVFKSGQSYEYRNVSRRAIINLILNKNMSLGFWMNANCLKAERTSSRHRYTYN
jgi:hypothetical protein